MPFRRQSAVNLIHKLSRSCVTLAAKERAIRAFHFSGRCGRALAFALGVSAFSLDGAVHAQKPLPFPAVNGEVAPPSAIAGLHDARPISPLEFSRAWLLKVEAVRRRRAELTADGRLNGMTPAAAAREGAALTGTLRIPVLPIRYADVPAPYAPELLAKRLFSTRQADTMTFAGYWREVSGGLLNVTGTVAPWLTLSKEARHYLSREQHGWGQFGRMVELRQEVLRSADESLDFAQFDNDGPDGIPDSADDDGFVDFVAFVYATACPGDGRTGAIWPHRAAMPPFETNDLSSRGQRMRIADYVILPAVDPQTCGPLHIGVLAHETGHALGLPDLYDYDASSQGIGAWGLMGTGSHNARYSPAHLSAWEKEQLGWVNVRWLTQSGQLELPPVEQGRVVYRYDLPRRNGEYLLLENRQRVGSDRYLPGHGLLAWRIDPERGELGAWNNDERRSAISLIEADGRSDLQKGARADGGDPYPGLADNRSFTPADVPTFRLRDIAERSRTVIANLYIGYDAPALVPESDAIRLTALAGDSVVRHTVRIAADGDVGNWSAATRAEWLRTRAFDGGIELSADTRRLPPGRYTEAVDLYAQAGTLAGRMIVDLYVALPGQVETIASDLPWSWGIAARGTQLFHASYGWDALGLRPRPRVLTLRDGQLHPATLSRLPADALYAPVPTADGKALYVVGRARGENYVYLVDAEGDAQVVAARFGNSPAYGAALSANGTLLVAEWNGTIWRLDAQGTMSKVVELPANVYQIATDRRGAIFAATYDGRVLRWQSGKTASVLETGFEKGKLVAVAAAPNGSVYAAERGDLGRILRFDPDGSRSIIFHQPGARFYGLAVDDQFLFALDLKDRNLLRIPVTPNILVADR